MSILTGPSWGPYSKNPPKQLIILCHGVGADGADLIGLAPDWGAALPDAVFVAPNGPEPFDMAPMGRQWFSIGDLDPAKLGDGVRRAAQTLDAFIDSELAKYRLPPNAYALLGFSQGAMTALFTGLRRVVPPAAIIALSGALIDPDALAAELKNHAPVFLGHGGMDAVVPAFRSRAAAAALQTLNIPVEICLSPELDHGIDATISAAALAFLQKCFVALE